MMNFLNIKFMDLKINIKKMIRHKLILESHIARLDKSFITSEYYNLY